MKFILFLSLLLLVACVAPTHNTQILSNERRTSSVYQTDKTIEKNATEQIMADEILRTQAHVNINAYNGAVLVSGQALSPESQTKIITLVQVIAHVKLVHNHLAVEPISTLETRANDKLLTENIKTALAQIKTLADFNAAMIKVVTENSVVYLMGRVHRNEGEVVIKLTRLQPGIKQIITVFEYLD